jgi:hypothetical protein
VEIDHVDPETVALGEAAHNFGNSTGTFNPYDPSCYMNPVRCVVLEPLVEFFGGIGDIISAWAERNENALIGLTVALVGLAVVSLAGVWLAGGALMAVGAVVGGVASLVTYILTTPPEDRTPTQYAIQIAVGVLTGVGKVSLGKWVEDMLRGIRVPTVSMPRFPVRS